MGGTFAEFVNNAIVAEEDGYRRVMAERKRSASAMEPSNGPPQKFRMVYTTPSGQRYRSAPVSAPVVRPPQPAQLRPSVPHPQQSQGGFRPPQRPNPQPGSFPCYNCGHRGHFSRECPHPKKGTGQNPSRSNSTNDNRNNRGPVRSGRVNNTTLEKIPENSPILAGMFSVRDHPALVLCLTQEHLIALSVGFFVDKYRLPRTLMRARQSAERIGKRKEKEKTARGTHLSATQRKHNPAEAALPRPSRAAWVAAYGQRPLPRIDGPTRTFGHPFALPELSAPHSLLALALSPPSPLLPPASLRAWPAALGASPSFQERRDDPGPPAPASPSGGDRMVRTRNTNELHGEQPEGSRARERLTLR
ncbi:hypothetical protein PR202_ga30199 [Eleusine coracana subsp. coracana]|uniref:CCHC-type domain-containing protein n=1 Tax=Eleusine coracana subsp. coracana TaxID=191504 RepID=A0AAV5DNN3_ELECO|nr:hypothetical protein PR202_ga30199 [Eleusine coracana subsp. coracana]